MKSKRLLLLVIGAALLFMLLACTGPTFRRTIDDPVMTPVEMETERKRLDKLNLTVGNADFDPSLYPLFAGVDTRNGRTLENQFICWDQCPEKGKVYLVYKDVGTEETCLNATGSPLISPATIPEAYWGCEPIIDWLSVPTRRPS